MTKIGGGARFMRQNSNPLRHIRPGITKSLAVGGMIIAPYLGFAQQPQIVIDDQRAFPESLTSTADGTIYIGSFVHGTVYRALPGAAAATPWIPAGPTDLKRGVGVFAHEPSNTLWVCSADPDTSKNTTILRAFDLKTAALKGSYPFPGGGFCNDIAVMRGGTTLATDTRGGRILALDPGAVALAVWAEDPKWIGIDGIAMLADGDVLFNNVRQNQLVRVAVKADGSAGAGSILELSQPIDGPDGMRALPDGRIVLAENRNGKIDIVRVDGGKATIDTIKEGFKLSPTAVTVTGATIWVTEAKFAYLNDPKLKDQDPGTFSAVAVALPPR
jgi:streptogramin lyase